VLDAISQNKGTTSLLLPDRVVGVIRPVLLAEHMQCGITIAKLEAQHAEHLAFIERFHSSLQREEYGQKE
jgi:hypothetical protein